MKRIRLFKYNFLHTVIKNVPNTLKNEQKKLLSFYVVISIIYKSNTFEELYGIISHVLYILNILKSKIVSNLLIDLIDSVNLFYTNQYFPTNYEYIDTLLS